MKFQVPVVIYKCSVFLINKLEMIGYKKGRDLHKTGYSDIISACEGYYHILSVKDADGYIPIRAVHTGANEELFLAIAALRTDSDIYQWFVTEADQVWVNQEVYAPKGSFEKCLVEDRYMGQNPMFCNTIVPAHKASVEELVAHFENK